MAHMSTKKQTSWTAAVHDAATGYSVVLLGIICYILVLVIIVAGVRIVIGNSSTTTNVTATPTNTATSATADGSEAA